MSGGSGVAKEQQKETGSTALPAKLTAPQVGKTVRRERLFRLLDAACSKPVVWLGAPAGAGKTTLVASYLAARKLKPLWYQFDLRDADPAAFFSYLRQAAAKLAPRKTETLPLLTPEYVLGLPAFTLNFFEQLFARLRPPAVLVFDNFQDIPESSPLHGVMEQLVSALPPGATLIFVSRTSPPTGFARLVAARKIAHIGAEEMALDAHEARQIVDSVAPGGFSHDRVDTLNEHARGWAAGLILLLEGAGTATLQDKEIDASVFDYFAAEIMRQADAETQAFLAVSSLLPVMDAASTAALTDNNRAAEILRDLVRRNYFITRRTGVPVLYEFHPLFRNFLLTELQRQTSAEELCQLQGRAGHLLAHAGDSAAAVELLTRAGAVEELVGLVLGQAEKLIAEGLYQTLAQWLQAVPAEARVKQPWLEFWLGVSRMPFDLLTARAHFELAYEAFTKVEDAPGIFLSWAGIAETFSLMWDDFGGMVPWLEKYGRLREEYPDFPSAEVEARVQAALFGVLMFIQPQHPESAAARETVETLLLVAPDPDFRVKMASSLSLYYSWAGAFTDMRRVVEMGERIIDSEVVSPLSRIMVKMNRGTLCWLTGEPVKAHEAIAEAMQIAEQSGVHLLDSYVLSQSAYASGTQNDTQSMGETVEMIRTKLSPHRRIDVAHYHFHMSWYKSLCGDYRAALEYVRHGMELLLNLSAQMPIALGRFCLAKALIQTGEYREAHDELELGISFAQAMPSKHLAFTGQMIRAYSWLQQQKQAECITELKSALLIGAQSEYWTFPLWDPRMVGRLCAVALQNGIEPDYARALIKKWQLLPTGDLHKLESWPWPVRIEALGSFSMLVDEQPAEFSLRGKSKVIDMLKAIIALGGRDVAEHRLCDALWPDADGDLARQNLKTTLHRLRKLIGTEAVVLHDGSLSLDRQRVWLDIWAFEDLLAALETAGDGNEISVLANEAVRLYRGGFLPQDRSSWLLPMHERLRGRFLRIIDQAAERLAKLNRWAEAMACYRKAIEIEPLAERFYVGLMYCHHHLGQAAEGLVVYRRCRDMLARELDIMPSAKTEEWHERLRQMSQ